MKLSIIGGGNMGGAIACGLAKSPLFRAEDICVTAHTRATLDRLAAAAPGLRTTTDNAAAAAAADILVLAVKPWLVRQVLEEMAETISTSKPLILSVAAGISFAELEQMPGVGAGRTLFRIIPNTAIAIGQSLTLIAASHADPAQVAEVQNIFDCLGQSVVIEERQMTAATALTSCGIAYAFQYIKAAVQAAVELGIRPETARRMVDQTVIGAAELLEHNGTMPDTEIYKVCTPGGITIKGLNAMAACGFDHAVIAGLKKAAGA